MSWAACQDAARHGRVDGIATISYEPARVDYLRFPPGAEKRLQKSPWRVSQVDYIVITPSQYAAIVPEDMSRHPDRIPNPVRAMASYAIVNDLTEKGVVVEQFSNSEARYQDLVKEQNGAIIDVLETALFYANTPHYRGQLLIHPTPIQSKSYYLAFSKNGVIEPAEMTTIWQAIVAAREERMASGDWLARY
jgi:hypothetical protein